MNAYRFENSTKQSSDEAHNTQKKSGKWDVEENLMVENGREFNSRIINEWAYLLILANIESKQTMSKLICLIFSNQFLFCFNPQNFCSVTGFDISSCTVLFTLL